MEVHVGDVVKVSGHSYGLEDEIGTVIEKLGDQINVCIHNAYGENKSHILLFWVGEIAEIIHTIYIQ